MRPHLITGVSGTVIVPSHSGAMKSALRSHHDDIVSAIAHQPIDHVPTPLCRPRARKPNVPADRRRNRWARRKPGLLLAFWRRRRRIRPASVRCRCAIIPAPDGAARVPEKWAQNGRETNGSQATERPLGVTTGLFRSKCGGCARNRWSAAAWLLHVTALVGKSESSSALPTLARTPKFFGRTTFGSRYWRPRPDAGDR